MKRFSSIRLVFRAFTWLYNYYNLSIPWSSPYISLKIEHLWLRNVLKMILFCHLCCTSNLVLLRLALTWSSIQAVYYLFSWFESTRVTGVRKWTPNRLFPYRSHTYPVATFSSQLMQLHIWDANTISAASWLARFRKSRNKMSSWPCHCNWCRKRRGCWWKKV